VRAAGRRIVVLDIDLFHHANRRFGGESHGWHDALYTWRLKWRGASLLRRAEWAAKRRAHRLLTMRD
jgi:hypothetical protein